MDLSWIDYGARMYKSDIGRWGVVDPLSEKYADETPYGYTFNNPVLFNDPTGMEGNVYGMALSEVRKSGGVTTVFSTEGSLVVDGERYQSEAHYYQQNPEIDFLLYPQKDGMGIVSPNLNTEGGKSIFLGLIERAMVGQTKGGIIDALRKETESLISQGFQKDAAALFSIVKNLPEGTTISGKDIVAALSGSFKSKNSGIVKELQKIQSITNQNGLIKINASARIDLGIQLARVCNACNWSTKERI